MILAFDLNRSHFEQQAPFFRDLYLATLSDSVVFSAVKLLSGPPRVSPKRAVRGKTADHFSSLFIALTLIQKGYSLAGQTDR